MVDAERLSSPRPSTPNTHAHKQRTSTILQTPRVEEEELAQAVSGPEASGPSTYNQQRKKRRVDNAREDCFRSLSENAAKIKRHAVIALEAFTTAWKQGMKTLETMNTVLGHQDDYFISHTKK